MQSTCAAVAAMRLSGRGLQEKEKEEKKKKTKKVKEVSHERQPQYRHRACALRQPRVSCSEWRSDAVALSLSSEPKGPISMIMEQCQHLGGSS